MYYIQMPNFKNPVLQSTYNIYKTLHFVHINQKKIKELAKQLHEENVKPPEWNAPMHIESNDEKLNLDYMIFVDALNFCSWPETGEKWGYIKDNKSYTGYFGLSLAAKQFYENQKPTYKYLSTISYENFKDIFQGANNLQLMEERCNIVKNIYTYLINHYDSDSRNFFKKAGKKFSSLIPSIANELYGFDDSYTLEDKKIYIWKRAQILSADVYRLFNNKGVGEFIDPEYLTAFADDALPQYFKSIDLITYTKPLKEKILNEKLIEKGSREEIELRVATIWVVELLKEELEKLGVPLYSLQLDDILWNRRRQDKLAFPRHRTLSINY